MVPTTTRDNNQKNNVTYSITWALAQIKNIKNFAINQQQSSGVSNVYRKAQKTVTISATAFNNIILTIVYYYQQLAWSVLLPELDKIIFDKG